MAKATVFLSIKRMFGEHTSVIKFQNMIKEMMIKVSSYTGLEEWHKLEGINLRRIITQQSTINKIKKIRF